MPDEYYLNLLQSQAYGGVPAQYGFAGSYYGGYNPYGSPLPSPWSSVAQIALPFLKMGGILPPDFDILPNSHNPALMFQQRHAHQAFAQAFADMRNQAAERRIIEMANAESIRRGRGIISLEQQRRIHSGVNSTVGSMGISLFHGMAPEMFESMFGYAGSGLPLFQEGFRLASYKLDNGIMMSSDAAVNYARMFKDTQYADIKSGKGYPLSSSERAAYWMYAQRSGLLGDTDSVNLADSYRQRVGPGIDKAKSDAARNYFRTLDTKSLKDDDSRKMIQNLMKDAETSDELGKQLLHIQKAIYNGAQGDDIKARRLELLQQYEAANHRVASALGSRELAGQVSSDYENQLLAEYSSGRKYDFENMDFKALGVNNAQAKELDEQRKKVKELESSYKSLDESRKKALDGTDKSLNTSAALRGDAAMIVRQTGYDVEKLVNAVKSKDETAKNTATMEIKKLLEKLGEPNGTRQQQIIESMRSGDFIDFNKAVASGSGNILDAERHEFIKKVSGALPSGNIKHIALAANNVSLAESLRFETAGLERIAPGLNKYINQRFGLLEQMGMLKDSGLEKAFFQIKMGLSGQEAKNPERLAQLFELYTGGRSFSMKDYHGTASGIALLQQYSRMAGDTSSEEMVQRLSRMQMLSQQLTGDTSMTGQYAATSALYGAAARTMSTGRGEYGAYQAQELAHARTMRDIAFIKTDSGKMLAAALRMQDRFKYLTGQEVGTLGGTEWKAYTDAMKAGAAEYEWEGKKRSTNIYQQDLQRMINDAASKSGNKDFMREAQDVGLLLIDETQLGETWAIKQPKYMQAAAASARAYAAFDVRMNLYGIASTKMSGFTDDAKEKADKAIASAANDLLDATKVDRELKALRAENKNATLGDAAQEILIKHFEGRGLTKEQAVTALSSTGILSVLNRTQGYGNFVETLQSLNPGFDVKTGELKYAGEEEAAFQLNLGEALRESGMFTGGALSRLTDAIADGNNAKVLDIASKALNLVGGDAKTAFDKLQEHRERYNIAVRNPNLTQYEKYKLQERFSTEQAVLLDKFKGSIKNPSEKDRGKIAAAEEKLKKEEEERKAAAEEISVPAGGADVPAGGADVPAGGREGSGGPTSKSGAYPKSLQEGYSWITGGSRLDKIGPETRKVIADLLVERRPKISKYDLERINKFKNNRFARSNDSDAEVRAAFDKEFKQIAEEADASDTGVTASGIYVDREHAKDVRSRLTAAAAADEAAEWSKRKSEFTQWYDKVRVPDTVPASEGLIIEGMRATLNTRPRGWFWGYSSKDKDKWEELDGIYRERYRTAIREYDYQDSGSTDRVTSEIKKVSQSQLPDLPGMGTTGPIPFRGETVNPADRSSGMEISRINLKADQIVLDVNSMHFADAVIKAKILGEGGVHCDNGKITTTTQA